MGAHDNTNEARFATGDQSAGKPNDHVEKVARDTFATQVLNTCWNDVVGAHKAFIMEDKQNGGLDKKAGVMDFGNPRDLYLTMKATGHEGFDFNSDGKAQAENEKRSQEHGSLAFSENAKRAADEMLAKMVEGRNPGLPEHQLANPFDNPHRQLQWAA